MESTPTESRLVHVLQAPARALNTAVAKSSRGLGRLGGFITRRPRLVLIVALIATALCAGGWARFRLENDADVLWTPKTSKSKTDREWVKNTYGASTGGATFLASVRPTFRAAFANNALRLEITHEIFGIDAQIRAVRVAHGGKAYGWTDLCDLNKFTGQCHYDGYLNFWSYDFAAYLAAVNGSAADPAQGSESALLSDVNTATYPDGGSVATLSFLGGVTVVNAAFRAAQVISISYDLRDELPDAVYDEWYDAVLDILKVAAARSKYSRIDYIADSSVGNEISRSISKDMKLVVIAVVIFIGVGILFLTRFDIVSTRTTLALAGVLAACLGLVAGYGLSMLFGCPFTSLQQTLPFILIGVGLDCMLVLTKAYDEIAGHSPHLTLRERMERVMATAGLSVGVTLLASTVAFALGAVSVLPSVEWFSVFACLATACICIAELTFFIAIFVYTERRIAANRWDCCCCVTRGGPLPLGAAPAESNFDASNGPVKAISLSAPYPKDMERHASRSNSTSSNASNQKGGNHTAIDILGAGQAAAYTPASTVSGDHHLAKTFFKKYYGPTLMRWPVKAVVICLFAGYAIYSGIATSKLQLGQPLSEIAPDDSYIQGYENIMQDTFQQQVGAPTRLYFRNIDPSNPVEQAKMFSALTTVLASPYINTTLSAFQSNWLISFIDWVQTTHPEVTLTGDGCYNPYVGRVEGSLAAFLNPKVINGCVPQAPFYTLLEEYLSDPARNGLRDTFKYSSAPPPSPSASRAITISYLGASHTADKGVDTYDKNLINNVHDLNGALNDGLFRSDNIAARAAGIHGLRVFAMYQGNYVYAEGDAVLGGIVLEYILLALLGVGIVVLFMVVNIWTALYMVCAVGLVDLYLFGEMHFLNLRFNQVSAINMIMATGLAVDYAIYFAQRFMVTLADGTRNGRVLEALSETGSAVFLGGLCALCGVVPLAFASSVILRTFFKLIFGTIIFALLVGLMLMPVVFSLIGPAPLLSVMEAAGTRVQAPGKAQQQTVQDVGAGVQQRRQGVSEGRDASSSVPAVEV